MSTIRRWLRGSLKTGAMPKGAPATVVRLQPKVDSLVCLQSPPDLEAVGDYDIDFGQTSDDEVRELLEDGRCMRKGPSGRGLFLSDQ